MPTSKPMDPVYTEYKKVLKDLVHDYISLTAFDLQIIDTPHFQRLKDIGQVTSQHVYPAAKHTRFEHALGVMELTRQAFKHIKENGFLNDSHPRENLDDILTQGLFVNLSVAALLHDIGHSPFSHLGEEQFERASIQEAFFLAIQRFQKKFAHDTLEKPPFTNDFIQELMAHKVVHEIISCILILEVYYDLFLESHPYIEYEFILRCILGLTYPEIQVKNVFIELINSDTLDMDKLDYIMRDSLHTGIGTPNIDTKRLFKNMYIKSSESPYIGFTSRAIPTIQTIIEARDSLYMWVYNHHVSILTDFLQYYIWRRLDANFKKWFKVSTNNKNHNSSSTESFIYEDQMPGASPIERFFSLEAIQTYLYSDSDVLSAMKFQYIKRDLLETGAMDFTKNPYFQGVDTATLQGDSKRLLPFLHMLFRRDFPKAWWKTIFEFSQFTETYFPDEKLRNSFIDLASNTQKYAVKTCEKFRATLIHKMLEDPALTHTGISEGDIFIIPRSNKFYSLQAIGDILVFSTDIASNQEKRPEDAGNRPSTYYSEPFTALMPQKDYEAFFHKNAFYVFMNESLFPHYRAILSSFLHHAHALTLVITD